MNGTAKFVVIWYFIGSICLNVESKKGKILLKSLFNSAPAETFAKTLAADFAKKFPPIASGALSKDSKKKFYDALNELHHKARQFGIEHKIGLYRKAKFSNTLKWELKDMGYDGDMVDEIIKGMLIAMAQKK